MDESRQTREYRRLDRLESQVEKVNVFGTTISGRKKIGNNEWVFGGDIQLNDVKSRASIINLTTGAISKLNTRYPDGKNRMNNFGVYAQHTYKFKNQKLVLNDGLRVQSIKLQSNIIDNSFFHFPDTAVNQSNIAITGNAGIVFAPKKSTLLSVTLSSAFRAPNIDDLSKIFESSTSAKQVVIPNANLKPETTVDYELGFQQVLSKTSSLKISAFYREQRNQVQLIKVYNAYPNSYNSFGNRDFGTVKGLTIAYDLRRTVNLRMTANYTLQFAEGTGSDATSSGHPRHV
jgi:hemoglobin/transferrin/lactoferrin receptor protein